MADTMSSDLAFIISKLDIDKSQVEFIFSKLFKYKDDHAINIICNTVQDNISHIENFYDALDATVNSKIRWGGTKPLMFSTPRDPTCLRIYPEILITEGTKAGLKSIDTCSVDLLKAFIEKYEAEKEDPHKKEKFASYERITKWLTNYIDMPTAKALTRFASLNVKDDVIRDFAARIDEYRKPLEIIFAETPEDYLDMYTGGPGSCMTPEAHENFKFLIDMKLCPASMYAFFPHTKGAYFKRNGKVVCRAICYNTAYPKKEAWVYGRIYSANSEYTNKFISALKELGFSDGQVDLHNPPVGTTFKVPAYRKKGGAYFMPVAYADNMNRGAWSATFDDKTKEFTITYGSKDPNRIQLSLESRHGHVLASHFITLECSNCGKSIRGFKANSTADTEEVFCSDSCAYESGYFKVINSQGEAHYQKEEDEEFVSVVGISSLKYSNMNAAHRNGLASFMNELGILEEEPEVVYPSAEFNFEVRDNKGQRWYARYNSAEHNMNLGSIVGTNRVPTNVIKHKTVMYDDSASIVIKA